MEARCNQETLVLGSPYNNESHQKLQAEAHVTVSNFKVFDHPHLRRSSGRVWLLKFSSLLPHLSIASEAQNSHIGRSLFCSNMKRRQIDCRTAADLQEKHWEERGRLHWVIIMIISVSLWTGLFMVVCLSSAFTLEDFQPDVSLAGKNQTSLFVNWDQQR